MTAADLLSLPGTGSDSVPLEMEVLVIATVLVFMPVVTGFNTIVIVLFKFLTTVPRLQVMVPLATEQLP